MNYITLEAIVASQAVKEVKTFNKDLFKSDIQYLTQSDGVADYAAYQEIKNNSELIFVQEDTTDKHQSVTNIAIYDNEIYLLKGTQKIGFGGQLEVSFSIQELTLNGFNYFANIHQPREEDTDMKIRLGHNLFLHNLGIQAEVKELFELSVFNPEYNCSTLNFKTEDKEYWLTFKNDIGLSKITVKDLASIKTQPCFIKL